MVNHNIVTETDGAVGFGCGPGSYIDENDLSTAEANAGAIGLGDGSEDLFFEVWEYTVAGGSSTYDSTDTFDLSGWTAFCGVGGTDADADGFTEECGDPDDTDPAVTP